MTTPLGRQMKCSRPEQSRWCLRSVRGTSNCCWQSKDFPGIIGEPTLQREFVSQLQRCRQSTSCRHLWGEPAGPRSRRVYIKRDVEIRKYGVTIGCPECMAITAGTTAQGHSDECWARIEQKMLEENVQGLMMRAAEQTWRWRWLQGIPFVLFNMVVPVRRGR